MWVGDFEKQWDKISRNCMSPLIACYHLEYQQDQKSLEVLPTGKNKKYNYSRPISL